jgi:VanZ family protein
LTKNFITLYIKWAKFTAVLWTLLIFIGCLMPARRIPKVHVPMVDKWTHFVLFGGFVWTWMIATHATKKYEYIQWAVLAALLGTFIELLQHLFPALHRSAEGLDVVADTLGGVLGALVFAFFGRNFKQQPF